MSSVSNIVITPPPPPVSVRGSRHVNLGEILGARGCEAFRRGLHGLSQREGSGWSRATEDGREVFRVTILDRLPSGVSSVVATVRVGAANIEVSQRWTAANDDLRARYASEIQRMVNAAVNQPLMHVVAEQIAERARVLAAPQRMVNDVRQSVLANDTLQVHVRQRAGGWQ